jgi:hypothetical protein
MEVRYRVIAVEKMEKKMMEKKMTEKKMTEKMRMT